MTLVYACGFDSDREQRYNDFVRLFARHDQSIRRFLRSLLPSPRVRGKNGCEPRRWSRQHTAPRWFKHFPVNRIDCKLHTTLMQDGKRQWVRPNNRPEICQNDFDSPWDPRADYHIYGVENSADWIVWYIDGKEVAKKSAQAKQ